jgi:uncharacterized membrane-anchored protein YjiN (DUF445 family)
MIDIDQEVHNLRNKLLETINNAPLPITVKRMVVSELHEAISEREKAHIMAFLQKSEVKTDGQ